jgi:hypothetical protein
MLLKSVFGSCLPMGRPFSTLHADAIKRAIADENSDDEFSRLPKRAVVRPTPESCGSSNAVVDENSDDDFSRLPKRAPVRAKARRGGSSKAVADENSDDDFM